MDIYAEKIHRYMAQSGARPDHLAMIAAKNHGNGALNPKAQFRTPRSTEEVLAARSVVPPLTLFMCSPISDGAAAIVLVAADAARDRRVKGPALVGCALAMDNLRDGRSQMVEVARTAYARAGIGPADVDVAEVHDATAAGELFALEDLGLAAPGTGWRHVEAGLVRIDGPLPINPSGGLLARGHPIGATGVAQVVELVWQMRGQAGPRQVARARIAVAHCAGGQAAFAPHNGAAAMAVSVLRAM
jgi:acetyl-CoA acetyltransferase